MAFAAGGHAGRHRKIPMSPSDPEAAAFNVMTSRLLRREALRRAAAEMNTTSGAGLEDMLARISAEVTSEAADRIKPSKA